MLSDEFLPKQLIDAHSSDKKACFKAELWYGGLPSTSCWKLSLRLQSRCNLEGDPEIELVVNYLLACQAKVREHYESGRVLKQKRLHIRSFAEDIHYTEQGLVQVNLGSEEVVREDWHWKDYQDFRTNVFPNLPEHRACVEALGRGHGTPEQGIERWLFLLTHSLAPRMPDSIEEAVLREKAAILINDVNRGPVNWIAYLWVQGIIIEDERLELDQSIVIRRPEKADFEMESGDGNSWMDRVSPGDFPSAVIEYRFQRGVSGDILTSNHVERSVEALLQVLRLFRVGSIRRVRSDCQPDSYCAHGFRMGGDQSHSYYRYSLGSRDIPDLNRLLASLLEQIPSYMEMLEPSKYPNILGIPLPRYTDCLERQIGVEERLASAVTCLEGLYFGDDETAELTFRLAQRVAITLRCLGF